MVPFEHIKSESPQDTIVWCACFNLKIALLMFSKKLSTVTSFTLQSIPSSLLHLLLNHKKMLSALHKAHKIFMTPLLWHKTLEIYFFRQIIC